MLVYVAHSAALGTCRDMFIEMPGPTVGEMVSKGWEHGVVFKQMWLTAIEFQPTITHLNTNSKDCKCNDTIEKINERVAICGKHMRTAVSEAEKGQLTTWMCIWEFAWFMSHDHIYNCIYICIWYIAMYICQKITIYLVWNIHLHLLYGYYLLRTKMLRLAHAGAFTTAATMSPATSIPWTDRRAGAVPSGPCHLWEPSLHLPSRCVYIDRYR